MLGNLVVMLVFGVLPLALVGSAFRQRAARGTGFTRIELVGVIVFGALGCVTLLGGAFLGVMWLLFPDGNPLPT